MKIKGKLCVICCNSRFRKKYWRYIDIVLNEIPKDVCDKICEECVVLIPDLSYGEYYRFLNQEAPILINACLMEDENVSRKHKLHVITHEFAHHVLGHQASAKNYHQSKKRDKDANKLAEEWGFPADERFK